MESTTSQLLSPSNVGYHLGSNNHSALPSPHNLAAYQTSININQQYLLDNLKNHASNTASPFDIYADQLRKSQLHHQTSSSTSSPTSSDLSMASFAQNPILQHQLALAVGGGVGGVGVGGDEQAALGKLLYPGHQRHQAGKPHGVDPYVCTECGKRYSTSSNLARHRQTHRSVCDKKVCCVSKNRY